MAFGRCICCDCLEVPAKVSEVTGRSIYRFNRDLKPVSSDNRPIDRQSTILKTIARRRFTRYHHRTIQSTANSLSSPSMAQVKLSDSTGDQWDEMAKIYQQLTVQTSRGPIGKMLERADALLPFTEATGILDNGCGPGPIMNRILEDYSIADTCSLTCADFSEGMVNRVRQQREDKMKEGIAGWDRLEALVQDATDLKRHQEREQKPCHGGLGLLHDVGSSSLSDGVEAGPQRWRRFDVQLVEGLAVAGPHEPDEAGPAG